MRPLNLSIEVAPYRLSGTVLGVLLNDPAALAALGEKVTQPPYKGVPRAPVLYVKPLNTHAADGDAVAVPAGVEVEVGPALGIVVGRTLCRANASEALAGVAGYTIVNDVGIPHESYYRPALRQKVRDGFCPIGPRVVPACAIANPDRLAVRVEVDGVTVHDSNTSVMSRSAGELLAAISEFMTLAPGDLVMLGVPAHAPRARAGQRVAIDIEGIGRLANPIVEEES
jgi:5-oxopent-3-ene-1,2,5-tricarboxylate decarboxylase/2-hydroxyhepta-2,4-diene-1,7-dioate isomerase